MTACSRWPGRPTARSRCSRLATPPPSSPRTTASSACWPAGARGPTAWPRPARWPRRPAPSCCSRARPPSWPSRGAASSSRPPATSGWPPPARATCSPASSARSSPSRSRPFEAAAIGAWLHGSAGTARARARSGRRGPPRAHPRRAGAAVIAVADPRRGAWVEVDLGAIATTSACWPRPWRPAALWVVVKADGYGHGAAAVARAALEAGAEGLCVALVQEGRRSAQSGIVAPILVLSEQPAAAAGRAGPLAPDGDRVHPRVPGRAGEGGPGDREPDRAGAPQGRHRHAPRRRPAGAARAAASRRCSPTPSCARRACGPTSPSPTSPPTRTHGAAARRCFDDVVLALERGRATAPPLVHAANSAAGLASDPGRPPRPGAGRHRGLRDRAEPGAGRAVPRAGAGPLAARPGEPRATAGRRGGHLLRPSARSSTGTRTIATLPLGYADGVPRRLSEVGGAVLIGGRRRPIVGVVTMDQLMVDCGDDPVGVGDEAVLLGRQGSEQITAVGLGQPRSARSPTRWCAGSAPAFPASTRARSRSRPSRPGRPPSEAGARDPAFMSADRAVDGRQRGHERRSKVRTVSGPDSAARH